MLRDNAGAAIGVVRRAGRDLPGVPLWRCRAGLRRMRVPIVTGFYQRYFDFLLSWRPATLSGRLLYRLARSFYGVLTRLYNPDLTYSIDGTVIRLPASHSTPFHWKYNGEYSKSLGRVALACGAKYPGALFVDVGANVGDSAAIIRAAGARNKIISIEGVERFYAVLRSNAETLRDVVPVRCFVGVRRNSGGVMVRIHRDGNAVVVDGPLGQQVAGASTSDSAWRELSQIVPGNETVKLLKTDIEGHDLPLLSANLDFIRRHRPVIFLELHVSDSDEKSKGVTWVEVWEQLFGLGYRKALYWHNSLDFLCMLDMDSMVTADLHDYYRNRAGHLYVDVSLFHEADLDMADKLHLGEIERFRQLRRPAATR